MLIANRRRGIPQRCLILAAFLSFGLVFTHLEPAWASPEDDAISKWADKFGEELWELGKRMTKAPEIKAKYKEYNARVERKDGEALIHSIVKNVGRMLSRKIDAIRCIMTAAEEEAELFDYNETMAENYTYYSSKYSTYEGYSSTELVESLMENEDMYLPFHLNQDTHFYNISVNTTHSSVHVPSNIYDKSPEVMEAIMWSESLDKVFAQNYNSDPALSWQYFGSDTGILRHYPAMQWDNKSSRVDVYDCRKRSWYIETATCSKDIVILVDNSGSMTGFRQHIARLTIRSILDTFSNNDFINIFNYSATVDDLVPCFNGTLVQATPENIDVFEEAVKGMFAEGYANVSKAFEKAFDLLEKYRIQRRCNESSTGCNQAIMLITDGLSVNATEIVEQYNSLDYGNSTKIPVRIFTYLLGKEVTKVQEIQEIACKFRGYYSHIQTLDQVQEEVLKYVDVIAVPLVLQGELHPPTWTHAFVDMTKSQEGDEVPRLMIAAGVPAFDRKMSHKNGTRYARLLGVAGTDIPIEDIDKLTLPYMLGVNGYSFIVSNNGYVLLHPELQPTEKNRLKRNYNSIDFTEVEQINDDRPVRDPGELLLDLRQNVVNHRYGNVTQVPVKFHYDKMRRVSPEYLDYFYAPLKDTPFSLGLVLPSNYGKTWIKVGDEVKRNQHMNKNISEFFVGENWKVHPLWVYCKYHYLEGHEFKTPEDELRHFLKKMSEPNWEWKEQYSMEEESDNLEAQASCTRKSLDDDAYYCNKELVQLLIFDAKVTNTSYGTWKFTSKYDRDLIERYNATLRYVATMSGLTRWQFIFGEIEVDTDQEFGDYHKGAIDETWYKSAILQHDIDPESFVYLVPHIGDPVEEEDRKVTSSHAIFPRDGGLEAPGCVVGFQFSHSMMWDRFMNITSEDSCNGCVKTCNTDEHDCYVIDNNGYVVLSENMNDTGKFFGEIEGAVMDDMVRNKIFKNITIFDLQAVCTEVIIDTSDGSRLSTPIKMVLLGIDWLMTELIWYWSRLNLWIEGLPFYDDPEQDYDTATIAPPPAKKKIRKGQDEDEEEYFNRPPEKKEITIYHPCDKMSNLYLLQQELFIRGNDTKFQADCSRPYHAKRIPKSNLLLVVIKTMYTTCYRYMTASPQVITYDVEHPCHKLNLNHLFRRRLDECYTEHPDEEAFTYCGDASSIYLKVSAIILSLVIPLVTRYLT